MTHSAPYDGRVTVILAGGGEIEALRPLVDRFIAHARVRGGVKPRIALITAATDARFQLADVRPALDGKCALVELVARLVPDGTDRVEAGFDGGELLDCDGVLVLDGPTQGLLNALEHRAGDLRRRVHDDVPYLGIGAGAAIAAELALVGGNEIGGVPVGPATTEAPGAELVAASGLGLVDLTIVPHAAGLGRVGIAVAAIEAGITDRILALDDATALEVRDGGIDVLGTGTVWQLVGTDEGVLVTTSRA